MASGTVKLVQFHNVRLGRPGLKGMPRACRYSCAIPVNPLHSPAQPQSTDLCMNTGCVIRKVIQAAVLRSGRRHDLEVLAEPLEEG
eukprot:749835-Pelagomonas_calceolata.AAC.7